MCLPLTTASGRTAASGAQTTVVYELEDCKGIRKTYAMSTGVGSAIGITATAQALLQRIDGLLADGGFPEGAMAPLRALQEPLRALEQKLGVGEEDMNEPDKALLRKAQYYTSREVYFVSTSYDRSPS